MEPRGFRNTYSCPADGTSDMSSMPMASGWAVTVVDRTEIERSTSAEFGMGASNAGVNDVDIDSTPGGRICVAAVQRETRLVYSVKIPARAGLSKGAGNGRNLSASFHAVGGHGLILLHICHARIGRKRRCFLRAHVRAESLEPGLERSIQFSFRPGDEIARAAVNITVPIAKNDDVLILDEMLARAALHR